jgi:serine/threonine protein phosphatase PrpC
VAVDVAWTVGPLRFQGFGFAKAQGELSEDAFAGHLRTGSVAVADGASTSWQAGEWALHLCDAWVRPDGAWGPGEHETCVAAVQRSFQDPGHTQQAGPSQWFADEVARRGAFAAFLGVSFNISAGQSVAYRALSVGDVCLLHYRNGMLVASFPITSSDELTSQPELIGSSHGRRTSPAKALSGELESGDVLVLATDGVAGYLLGESASKEGSRALTYGSVAEVAEALETARATGEMVDDDYTLVRVTL